MIHSRATIANLTLLCLSQTEFILLCSLLSTVLIKKAPSIKSHDLSFRHSVQAERAAARDSAFPASRRSLSSQMHIVNSKAARIFFFTLGIDSHYYSTQNIS